MVRKKGWNCERQDDGTQKCVRVEQDKTGKKVATGTEIGIGVDQNTCEPVFSGDTNAMMDEDADAINVIANRMTNKCREKKIKGL